jgi:energy-coupling factor transport system ATP-binding protein
MTMIQIEHLSYIYSAGTPFEKRAVDDISIEVQEGEFVGVIGHTGSGKSTLIQHLNGLLKPTEGKVRIGGEDIWKEPSKIRRFRFQVGLVFQYPEHQLFEETVRRDIAFGPRNMGLSETEQQERVLEAARFVGLDPGCLERSPFELSGGQRRRAAIAGVIAMRPRVLILDEPTAGLDPRGRESILDQIGEYHRRSGTTVLLVSHSMEDIAQRAGRVLVLNQAKVFDFDTVDAVFSRAGELEKIGLNVPQITRIFARLADGGYPVPRNVYTVEAARKALIEALGTRRRSDA